MTRAILPVRREHRSASLLAQCMAAACAAMLGACALMHHDPGAVAQVEATRVQLPSELALPAGTWPSETWWQQYDDPQLTVLIERALSASPTMAIAREHVALAHAQARLAWAAAGPQINATAAIDRTHVSANGYLSAYAGKDPAIGADGPWYTTGLVGFEGAWDIDIWGLHRAQIAAAVGVENAQKAEEANIALELSTDVARLYYTVQTAYASIDLLKQERDALAFQLDAHRVRHERGLEPETLARQSEARMLSVSQQIAQTTDEVTTAQESLRALLGADSTGLAVLAPKPLPALAAGVPPSLGFQLLARRPDLQALHWYVVSSLKRVDAARAAFYPNFDIKAFFGFNALDLSQLFLHRSQQIDIIPGLSLPVFDSGRLNASFSGERATSNAAILQYNQAVLNAVRDVAQTGSELQDLSERTGMQQRKLDDVQFAFDSASALYGRGLADKLQVEAARETQIQERLAMLQLRSQSLQASIALTKTLGGGYQAVDDTH